MNKKSIHFYKNAAYVMKRGHKTQCSICECNYMYRKRFKTIKNSQKRTIKSFHLKTFDEIFFPASKVNRYVVSQYNVKKNVGLLTELITKNGNVISWYLLGKYDFELHLILF